MKNWIKILTFLVAIETLLVGIYCCCELKIDSNSASVLIASLGVLVTFLVAWQIWQTMASREEIRKAEAASRKVDKLQDELRLLKDVPDGYLFYTLAIIYQSDERYYEAFDYYHSAIRCFIRNGVDYAKYTTVALDSMLSCLDFAERKDEILTQFKDSSARIRNMIISIEKDIDNVNRLVDEARSKVSRIKNRATKLGIITQ